MKIYIITLLCVFSINSSAQTAKIDSLENALKHQQVDSLLVMTNYELFWQYFKSDLNKAEFYANKIIELSEEFNYLSGKAMGYDCKTSLEINQAKYNQAIKSANSLKTINVQLKHENANAIYQNKVACIYYYKADYDSAIYCWNNALVDYTHLGDVDKTVQIQSNIGSVLISQGKYQEALFYFKEAQGILENETQDSTTLVKVYNNIGIVFHDLGNYQKANDYYNRALKIARQSSLVFDQEMLLFNIGNLLVAQIKYQDAIAYYEESKEIRLANGIPIGESLVVLGNCYFHTSEYALAEDLLLKSVSLLLNSKNDSHLNESYLYLAKLYKQINQLDKALQYTLKSVSSLHEIENDHRIIDSYAEIIQLSFILEKFDMAQEYTSKLLVLQDSLYNEDVIAKVYEIESKYEQVKNEKEIAILHSEKEIAAKNKQLLLLLFSSGIFFLVVIILSVVYRNRNLIAKRKVLELESKHSKLVMQHKTLLLSKKREEIGDVIKKLKILKADPNTKNVTELLSDMNTNSNIEKNWVEYLNSFEKLNPLFFENTLKMGVKLTANDKRLCVFICQGLTIKQISTALNNNTHSVENARSRLRKKFNLEPSQNLSQYLKDLCTTV